MHVTILGASGFVGSALARHLVENCNAQVTALRRPLFDLTAPETFELIPEDTDVLVHAAGAIGNGLEEKIYWDVNVISTHNLVRFLNSRPKKPHLIYLSTGAASGGRKSSDPSSKKYEVPDGIYASTKFISENIIERFYIGSTLVPRIYFPYGKFQEKRRLIPRLIGQVKQSKSITISRGGGPLLSMVHIRDLVGYLGNACLEQATGKVDLAGHTTIRLSQIIAAIEFNTGHTALLNEVETPSLNYFAENMLPEDQKTLAEGIAEICSEGKI